MVIKKESLPDKKILLVVSTGDYYDDILDTVKQLQGKSICYVTLNKTRKALQEDFKKNGIDVGNIMIVDAISKTVEPSLAAEEHCFFVSSPGALTELSIAIRKFLNYDFEYIIFDSLNNLLIYREVPIVKRWLSSIINSIKGSKSKAIFYTVNSEEQQDFIKEVGSLVDEVVVPDKTRAKDRGGSVAFTGELKK